MKKEIETYFFLSRMFKFSEAKKNPEIRKGRKKGPTVNEIRDSPTHKSRPKNIYKI
jgi:hypothetical protein